MKKYGFIRVGNIVNNLKIGDPLFNREELVKLIKEAFDKGISIVNTPELSLTGYSCGDLFYQDSLINEVENSIKYIIEKTKNIDITYILGAPLKIRGKLYNCNLVVNKNNVVGIIPKKYVDYDFENRWFASWDEGTITYNFLGNDVIVGNNLVFKDINDPNLVFSVGFDSRNLIGIGFMNDSQYELVGNYEFIKNTLMVDSKRNRSALVYTSCGLNESSSAGLYGGYSFIFENGKLLNNNERFDFDSNITYADVDYEDIVSKYNEFIDVDVVDREEFNRLYKEYPFVPSDDDFNNRCSDIVNTLSCGLARRLKQLGYPKCVLGISGGLDSTLAFLIVVEAYKKLKLDLKNIIGITMPGFGTTGRTYNNACDFVKEYGATLREISIKDAAILHMKDIGLDENDRSVAYENLQARERTQILMDVANMENGFVIGTGDLSETALGWCTYNGDHMSMYSVNANIPKTLVRILVKWFSDNANKKQSKVINSILDTPISPELLPPDEAGNILQKTESSIGPYVLHDFFLYHFYKGKSIKKIYFIARETFKNSFDDDDIKKWLKVFVRRFFTQQFKRNCVPDGVNVGSVSLDSKKDFVMNSDVSMNVWLNEIDNF